MPNASLKNAFLLSVCIAFVIASIAQSKPKQKIIFETDMGNDVDDALALDMLYKYMDAGKINLLAVCSNKNSGYSPSYIRLMNEWYGYPKIPVGKLVNGANSRGDAKDYTKAVCEYKTPEGKPVFSFKDSNSSVFTDAVELYRKILAQQPDSSVTIISVGFSTNLAKLLSSQPDKFSPLDGKTLVAKKVSLLSVMAGRFVANDWAEYNVKKDVAAAKKLFDNWPGQIVCSPFELGFEVTYPASSIENDFAWAPYHPAVLAYKSYMAMPYDRPTWDLTAVLYAVEGAGNYFSESPSGRVIVDAEGRTTFMPSPLGRHRYLLSDKAQKEIIKKHFISLITAQPGHFKK